MRISKEKKDKISEQILSELFHFYPKALFTAEIAKNLARDEEFVKSLMLELKNKNLVSMIKKNPQGEFYSRRIRWILSPQAFQAYKQQI